MPKRPVPRRGPDTVLRSLRDWLALGEPTCTLVGPAGIGKASVFGVLHSEMRETFQVARLQRVTSCSELCTLALQELDQSASADPESELIELAERSLDSHEGLLVLLDDTSQLPASEATLIGKLCDRSLGSLRLAFATNLRGLDQEMLDAFGPELVRIDFGVVEASDAEEESELSLPSTHGAGEADYEPSYSRGGHPSALQRLGVQLLTRFEDYIPEWTIRLGAVGAAALSLGADVLRALGGAALNVFAWAYRLLLRSSGGGGSGRAGSFSVWLEQIPQGLGPALRGTVPLARSGYQRLLQRVDSLFGATDPKLVVETRVSAPEAPRAPEPEKPAVDAADEDPDLEESVLDELRDWSLLGEPALALIAPPDIAKPLLMRRFAREVRQTHEVARVYMPAIFTAGFDSPEVCDLALRSIGIEPREDPESELLDAAAQAMETGQGVIVLIGGAETLRTSSALNLAAMCRESNGSLRVALTADPGRVQDRMLEAFGPTLFRVLVHPANERPTSVGPAPIVFEAAGRLLHLDARRGTVREDPLDLELTAIPWSERRHGRTRRKTESWRYPVIYTRA